MSVVPFPAIRADTPGALFGRQTRARAADMVRAVADDRVGRRALLEAAAMLICAAALEDDEPVVMATALIDALSELAYDLIDMCEGPRNGRV